MKDWKVNLTLFFDWHPKSWAVGLMGGLSSTGGYGGGIALGPFSFGIEVGE